MVFGVLFLVLLALNSADPRVDTYEYWGASAIMAIVFPVVGALIVSRYPANTLGWVFCLIGFFIGVGDFASQYAIYTLLTEPGLLPGGVAVAWLGWWVGDIGFLSFVFIPLLFPDGRPPSRRWWPVVWLAAGLIALVVISNALMPGPLEGYPSIINPFGIERADDALGLLVSMWDVLFLLMVLASVVSLVLRYRRSRGDERQQLKWLTYAVAVVVPLSFVGNDLFPELAWLIGGVGVASIPVAIGVAILKYRLYDIDIVINRTLVYGALTAMLVGVYFGGVVALQALLRPLTGQESQLAVVASTLAIAALFNPLRRRIQGFIDHRFYRRKYDARKTLEAFSAKLRSETDLDALNDELVGVVRETMQPAHVSLWLRSDKPPKGEQAD